MIDDLKYWAMFLFTNVITELQNSRICLLAVHNRCLQGIDRVYWFWVQLIICYFWYSKPTLFATICQKNNCVLPIKMLMCKWYYPGWEFPLACVTSKKALNLFISSSFPFEFWYIESTALLMILCQSAMVVSANSEGVCNALLSSV